MKNLRCRLLTLEQHITSLRILGTSVMYSFYGSNKVSMGSGKKISITISIAYVGTELFNSPSHFFFTIKHVFHVPNLSLPISLVQPNSILIIMLLLSSILRLLLSRIKFQGKLENVLCKIQVSESTKFSLACHSNKPFNHFVVIVNNAIICLISTS